MLLGSNSVKLFAVSKGAFTEKAIVDGVRSGVRLTLGTDAVYLAARPVLPPIQS